MHAPTFSLVTNRVEEWVLNATIERSQGMLGSFAGQNTMMATVKIWLQFGETIHAYFEVAFQTQVSTRFVTGELCCCKMSAARAASCFLHQSDWRKKSDKKNSFLSRRIISFYGTREECKFLPPPPPYAKYCIRAHSSLMIATKLVQSIVVSEVRKNSNC